MRWTRCVVLFLAGCDLLLPGPVVQEAEPEVQVEDPPPCEEYTFYGDSDGDGFGDADRVIRACELPNKASERAGDCDDMNAAIRPGAEERCDGVDQDCDGTIDEDAIDPTAFYADGDGDGFGGESVGLSCSAPRGSVARAGDCNDADADIHPGASEPVCSLVDLDCDGNAGRAAVQGGSAYDTIQEAIDAAPERGQVLVCPGNRVESLTLSRGIRLSSTSGSSADTRITAPPGGRVLTGTATSVTLTGLTLAGRSRAEVQEGGIISLESNGLEIEDCRLLNGRATQNGGAIRWTGLTSSRGSGASLTLERVVVANHQAGEHGGALYLQPGINGGVRFDRVAFRDNVAGGDGGAVFVQEVAGSAVTWNASPSDRNQAERGGALFALSSGAGSATTVLNSTSTDDVGGAFASRRRLVLEDVVIRGVSGGPGADAPRITANNLLVEDATDAALDADELTLEDSTLHGNAIGARVSDDLRFTDVDVGAGNDANDRDIQFAGKTFNFAGTIDARCSGAGCVEL